MTIENIDYFDKLKKSAIKSSFFLITRQFFVYSFNLAGAVFLTRFFTVELYGYYVILTFIFFTLTLLSNPGIGASLIRSTINPSNNLYSSLFFISLSLSLVISIIFYFITPYIISVYNFSNDDIITLRLLIVCLVLSTIVNVPLTILERNLNFSILSFYDILQSFIFNFFLVFFVYYDFGLFSFVLALFLKILLGTIYIYKVFLWIPSLNFSFSDIRPHLYFGLNYQGVKIISLIKDSFIPLFIGSLIGSVAVGQLNWVNLIALFPVMFVFLIQKIYLPYFAKLQNNKKLLSEMFNNMTLFTNILVAPIAIFIIFFIEKLTLIIFGDKWLDAIPYFYFIWIANIFVPTVSVCMGLFDALGYSKINFKFSLLWAAINWLIGIPLVYFFGIYGFLYSVVLALLTNFFIYYLANKFVNFNFLNLLFVWLYSFISCLIFFYIYKFLKNHDFLVFLILFILYIIFYLVFIFTLFKNKVHFILNSINYFSNRI